MTIQLIIRIAVTFMFGYAIKIQSEGKNKVLEILINFIIIILFLTAIWWH